MRAATYSLTVPTDIAGPGKLGSLNLLGFAGAAQFVDLFDLPASAVTVGETAPVFRARVDANGQRSITFGVEGAPFSHRGWSAYASDTAGGAATSTAVTISVVSG